MKITFISDTHNKHNHLTSNAYNNILGSGDVLVHAGDCTSMGKSHEITNFLNWLGMTDFKHKIFIAGNHDFGFETHTDIAEEFKERGIIYLFDTEVVIDGVKFYGSPWQPEFYDWAFNLPRGEKLAEKLMDLHTECSIGLQVDKELDVKTFFIELWRFNQKSMFVVIYTVPMVRKTLMV